MTILARHRRFVLLAVLALFISAAVAVAMPKANASPAPPAPTQMNYACAMKDSGLLRYVTSTAKCARNESPVTVAPGPHYVCVDRLDLVYLVASPGNCTKAKHLTALTLPPSAGPVYFCVLKAIGTLTYTTSPGRCLPVIEFPVVVPQPHTAPVLTNIESTALAYQAGSPPVPVTTTMTVSSADATTLAGATVTISSGRAAGDVLGFTSQNGIIGSYSAATGVLTLTGKASLAAYQAALRSVTYSSGSSASGTRTVSFRVNDGAAANNLSNVASRTVDVAAPPDIVTVTNPGDQTGVVNAEFAPLQITATDSAPGQTLTWSAAGLPPGPSIDPATGVISSADGVTAPGVYGVTVTATDTTGAHGSATFTWTVTEPEPAPVLSNIETTALAYTAGSPPVAVTSTLTVSSAGASTLAGATVTISSGLAAAGDSLGFTSQNGITGSYNASTGVLTLTGTASLAAYQAALRSVSYSSSSSASGTRTVSFQVNDGAAADYLSNVASRTVDVAGALDVVTVTNPGEQGSDRDDPVDLQMAGTDSLGLPLTWSETGLPAGLSIDASTGLISGVTLADASAEGNYLVTVAATDGTASDSLTFVWMIGGILDKP